MRAARCGLIRFEKTDRLVQQPTANEGETNESHICAFINIRFVRQLAPQIWTDFFVWKRNLVLQLLTGSLLMGAVFSLVNWCVTNLFHSPALQPSSDLRRNFILCWSISKAGHLEISTQLSRNGRLRRSIRGVTCCSAGFKLTDWLIWNQHNCPKA